MKPIRVAGLFVGIPIVTLAFLGLILLVIRGIYVELRGPVVDQDHLAQKQRYLEGIESSGAERPNLVLIFFDDLGWGDLSSYGNTLIETPHMDALAAEGVRMTNFYSASPVCTPSRAALLTGRYPPRTRTDRHVFFNDYHVIGWGRRILGFANALPKEEITLPEVLQRVGYRTYMVGKWHLGSTEGYWPTDFGFDNWFGVLYSNDMYPLHLYENDELVIEDKREGSFFASERDEKAPLEGQGIDQTRLTRMYTDKAIEFLETQGDEPFFLYLPHSFPHVPHYADERFAGQSKGGTYGDVVEDLDRSTGAIVEALSKLGLDDNTVVIVTSDNGADYNGSAGPLRGRKQEILEGGQRVPMIVRWLGRVPGGVVNDAMAMNTDLMPTILDFLDLPLPQDRIIDGKSIVQTLVQGTETHDVLYYFPTVETVPGAIRDQAFKLTLATGDPGRDREHLSRIEGVEAHEVGNLYPDLLSALLEKLEIERKEIAENPRGWVER